MYTVPGFKHTTFGTCVSSHNHQTRAPALIFTITYLYGFKAFKLYLVETLKGGGLNGGN